MKKKKDGLTLPESQTPMGKLLQSIDPKTAVLILGLLGTNGTWYARSEPPGIPLDQYTSVVTVLTQLKADALTALENCKLQPSCAGTINRLKRCEARR